MTHGAIKKESVNSPDNVFKGAFWLPNGHSQTLWRKFAGAKPIVHRRERVELRDGDFIDLDWASDSDFKQDQTTSLEPIVLIVHGLCGCSESSYVLALQQEMQLRNVCSVVMNLRGCSGEPNRKARTYHSGVSDDLAEVFAHLKKRFPQRPFTVIGYSLGGNVLLKWLGEAGRNEQSLLPEKAIAVSTPFNLALCSREMLSGFSRIYGRYFTRRLIESLEVKKSLFQQKEDKEELEKLNSLGDPKTIRSIWEFDERVTAPLHGFRNANDYYEQCSSIGYLSGISVPTLLIQSHNDPMIPPAALPRDNQLSSSIEFELQSHGGHVGFVAGLNKGWLENRVSRFILN